MKQKETVTIGSELKEILGRKGMTSYRLAKELAIGQSYLSRLFQNKFNPSYGLVKKVAEMLGYDLRLVRKFQRKGGELKLKARRSTGKRRDT